MSAPRYDAAADLLVRALQDSGEDFLENLETLAPCLPLPLWERVAGQLDACPIHVCDVEICRDDEDPGCPAGRASAQAKKEAEVIGRATGSRSATYRVERRNPDGSLTVEAEGEWKGGQA